MLMQSPTNPPQEQPFPNPCAVRRVPTISAAVSYDIHASSAEWQRNLHAIGRALRPLFQFLWLILRVGVEQCDPAQRRSNRADRAGRRLATQVREVAHPEASAKSCHAQQGALQEHRQHLDEPEQP
ncbi:hypothetical protein D3C78_1610830 [compost metagenome]